MIRKSTVIAIVLSLAGCVRTPDPLDGDRWQAYAQHFISEDGRVIDNGNGGISHSEGQGYGMLLAVAAGDRASFERLWGWTEAHLAVRDDGLFAWQWRPNGAEPVPDRNNATDGDLLIAWALARAAHRFDAPHYGQRAGTIAAALRQHLSRGSEFGQVLLPGSVGFESEHGLVINPSYFIFSAYRELARWDSPAYWRRLEHDNRRILQAILRHYRGLAPDWLSLAGNKMTPAPHAPMRFGFDALRIPLYVCWSRGEAELPMAAIAEAWRAEDAPAWRALDSEAHADFPLTHAHRAVRWLLTHCLNGKAEDFSPSLPNDYYGATLWLLAEVAAKDRHD